LPAPRRCGPKNSNRSRKTSKYENFIDLNALIARPYTQKEPSGGFLPLTVETRKENNKSSIRFALHDENGLLLYQFGSHTKPAANN
jgi:hypothetical protein